MIFAPAIAYVAVGGAIGSVLRYVMATAIMRTLGNMFPYGTLAINVLGSFFMGVLAALIAAYLPEKARELQWFLAVGVLGGFTTFSAFSLDAIMLIERGHLVQAGIYIGASVLLSLLALLAGLYLIRGITA